VPFFDRFESWIEQLGPCIPNGRESCWFPRRTEPAQFCAETNIKDHKTLSGRQISAARALTACRKQRSLSLRISQYRRWNAWKQAKVTLPARGMMFPQSAQPNFLSLLRSNYQDYLLLQCRAIGSSYQ
jgi:hypothetical protein